MKSSSRYVHLYLLMLTLAFAQSLSGQTFRGGIAGTVQDTTGAVVANAKISLIGTETGSKRETISTSSGDYSFQDLPLETYNVVAEAPGFSTTKIDKIVVRPGQIYSLEIKLPVASSAQQIEVTAAAVSLDTESSTNADVVNEKAVENIPLNGRDFTQLVKVVPGYNGAGSLNGTRTNQNNWQIDGADNNDIWQNGAAANQGGVGSIAGVTIPIDAIDQFSVQTQGNAEVGRNGGGLISLAIKSGTNHIHGSAYYFNRNEFFAVKSPFLLSTQRKPELRNQQFGGSVGGPIIKDKLFYFVNYEEQKYLIQNSAAATEPTTAYVQAGTSLLAKHGIPVNPLSLKVLAIWPEGNQPVGPASPGNFLDGKPQTGYSYNSIGKVDWTITPRQTLSVRGFIGTGRQFAAIGIRHLHDLPPSAPPLDTSLRARVVAGSSAWSRHVHDQHHACRLRQQSSVRRPHGFVYRLHSSFHCCARSRAAGRNQHEQNGMGRHLHRLRRIGTFDESQHTRTIADQRECTGLRSRNHRRHSMGSGIGAFSTHGD